MTRCLLCFVALVSLFTSLQGTYSGRQNIYVPSAVRVNAEQKEGSQEEGVDSDERLNTSLQSRDGYESDFYRSDGRDASGQLARKVNPFKGGLKASLAGRSGWSVHTALRDPPEAAVRRRRGDVGFLNIGKRNHLMISINEFATELLHIMEDLKCGVTTWNFVLKGKRRNIASHGLDAVNTVQNRMASFLADNDLEFFESTGSDASHPLEIEAWYVFAVLLLYFKDKAFAETLYLPPISRMIRLFSSTVGQGIPEDVFDILRRGSLQGSQVLGHLKKIVADFNVDVFLSNDQPEQDPFWLRYFKVLFISPNSKVAFAYWERTAEQEKSIDDVYKLSVQLSDSKEAIDALLATYDINESTFKKFPVFHTFMHPFAVQCVLNGRRCGHLVRELARQLPPLFKLHQALFGHIPVGSLTEKVRQEAAKWVVIALYVVHVVSILATSEAPYILNRIETFYYPLFEAREELNFRRDLPIDTVALKVMNLYNSMINTDPDKAAMVQGVQWLAYQIQSVQYRHSALVEEEERPGSRQLLTRFYRSLSIVLLPDPTEYSYDRVEADKATDRYLESFENGQRGDDIPDEAFMYSEVDKGLEKMVFPSVAVQDLPFLFSVLKWYPSSVLVSNGAFDVLRRKIVQEDEEGVVWTWPMSRQGHQGNQQDHVIINALVQAATDSNPVQRMLELVTDYRSVIIAHQKERNLVRAPIRRKTENDGLRVLYDIYKEFMRIAEHRKSRKPQTAMIGLLDPFVRMEFADGERLVRSTALTTWMDQFRGTRASSPLFNHGRYHG